jgi:hypothetical protein
MNVVPVVILKIKETSTLYKQSAFLCKTYNEGIKEDVVIGWLRGSKKDTFSLPELQKLMENT